MKVNIGNCQLELVQGDITQQSVDAIVNAANSGLAGGAGVDGAIHRVGGPAIMQDTNARYPEGCATGNAVESVAGNLNAKHVFHAVGPVWRGGRDNEPQMLASAYRKCMKLSLEHKCSSIAFPAISTGVYGYPLDLAARTSLKTIVDFIKWHKEPALTRFVLFDAAALAAYSAALEDVVSQFTRTP
ncbi:MAG: macro domain-containing protein [Planctomycetaceae bacterium]|nr:macro domain-containing protein [Planctomycetaceae bacterium]